VRIAAALLACGLVLTGCGGSDGDGKTDAEPKSGGPTVEIVIKDGKVTPRGKRIDVKAGDPVTLHITSDADEEIHVHSDPEHEYEVAAGDDVTKSFTLTTPGQVAVEAHHLDATIVQLVVTP
jgi:plastocyanin